MMKKKHIKDPGSAITHFIGMLMAIFAAFPLLIKAAHEPSRIYLISLAIYAVSLIFLYAASTTYHTFDLSERVNTILKKIDHMMIFVLIAGSYTPICLLVLERRTGLIMLALVWGIAITGIIINGMDLCPRIQSDPQQSDTCRIRMASRRRNHLHNRWCNLCTEASDFQQ